MEATFTDPFAFFEMFPAGQSVAVVGNSGALASWKMGDEIERRDVVIRFNECRVRSFATQVGQRTDLLITNPYVEGRERTVGTEIHPKMAAVIFSHQRRGDRRALVEWLNHTPAFTTFAPRIVTVENIPPNLPLSTGTSGIYLASRFLRPSSMLITGFSLFDGQYPSYYWSKEMPAGVAKHDFPREAFVFAQLLNGLDHPIVITPEVANVFERTQILACDHIQVIDPPRNNARH